MSPPVCTTLGVLVCTRRRMPSRRQAASTFRVPSTLLRSKSAAGPQMPAFAATCSTTSQPSAARSTSAGIARSPRTVLAPAARSAG